MGENSQPFNSSWKGTDQPPDCLGQESKKASRSLTPFTTPRPSRILDCILGFLLLFLLLPFCEAGGNDDHACIDLTSKVYTL